MGMCHMISVVQDTGIEFKKHFGPCLQSHLVLLFGFGSAEMDVDTRSKRDVSESLWFR